MKNFDVLSITGTKVLVKKFEEKMHCSITVALPVLGGLSSIFCCWWRKDNPLELFLCGLKFIKSFSLLLLSLFAIFTLPTFYSLSRFTRTSCVRNEAAQLLNKKENHFTNSRMCSSMCSAHLSYWWLKLQSEQ